MKTRLRYFISALLLLYSLNSIAQYTVSGKVTDQNGSPLPGVNVTEKGTTNGVATDADGKFYLRVSQGATLIFSFVGFQNKEIQIANGQTSVGTIKMSEEAGLNEVVVSAHGVSRSRRRRSSRVRRARRPRMKRKRVKKNKPKKIKTWKRSSGEVNRVRLEIGDKETLPLKSRQIAVKIEGFRARVLMDCFFYNDKRSQFEGTFKLRLPNGASPYFFAFGETKHSLEREGKTTRIEVGKVDYKSPQHWQFDPDSVMQYRKQQWSRVKQARVVPKQKAAKAYTETVVAKVDPALMEWSGADVFSCRVFPLAAQKMHHIVIGYDLNLLEANDHSLLQLALGNTKDRVPLRVDMLIEDMPASELEITPDVPTKVIGSATRLYWNDPQSNEIKVIVKQRHLTLLNSSGINSSDSKGVNYFATSFQAKLPRIPKTNLKENVVFLLDVSLSSQPDKFNVWLKTLEALLQNNQDVIKNFSVLCFNVEAFWWKQEQVSNNRDNINRFLDFANKLSLEGATNLGVALDEVNRADWLKSKSKYLFLLSDGDVTWGEDNLHRLSKKIAKNDELYAFSTGFSGTDPRILDHLSRNSNGAVFSIIGEDEVQKVSQNFRYSPWRIEQITMTGASDFILAGKPQYLYAGQKVILAGRHQQLKNSKLNIKLSQKGKMHNVSLDFAKHTRSELAKRVYGQIATNQLEELGYIAEKEAIQYGVHYRVPGQTCALVMLESERDYKRHNITKEDNIDYITKNPLSSLLQKLLTSNGQKLGDAKGEFIHFLNKLSNLQGDKSFKFVIPSNLKALIEKIPADYYEVVAPRLRSKRHTPRLWSKLTRGNLLSGELDYQVITTAAEKRSRRNKDEAIRLLSSLVEKNAGDLNLLRDVGFWIMKWGETAQSYSIFRKLINRRPFQPASYQLIAQALQDMGKNELAMLYYEVVLNIQWSSEYAGIQNVVRVEYIRLLNKMLEASGSSKVISPDFMEQRLSTLSKVLRGNGFFVDKADLLVTINWNTDETDVDLHVTEANGETCYYQNNRTSAGGYLSKDMTQGFGPEMYFIKTAPKGACDIKVNYYSDNTSRYDEKTKVYLRVYKNWGKPNEKITRQVISLSSYDIRRSGDKLYLISKLKF